VTQVSQADTTRRAALADADLAGLVPAVAACGATRTAAAGTGSHHMGSGMGGSGGGSGRGGSGLSGSGGGSAERRAALTHTSDIPVGGGKIFTAKKVVVTQPRPGQLFRWRFLSREHCWQSHPYSLSAVARPDALRITVKARGDGSDGLRRRRIHHESFDF